MSMASFMYFENLTYVPIDLDAIDPNQMTDREKRIPECLSCESL